MIKTRIALFAAISLVNNIAPAQAEDAWINKIVPASANARFDIGAVPSTNIAASISSGLYFVTDLGDAPSGTFRRIRNAGANSIPFVMDGRKIVGYAPASPIGGPGGTGGSRVLPVAPNEVVEFVSLGSDAWQLVQYLPLGLQNFGLQAGYQAGGGLPTNSPPENWFQLGPIAGRGPEPDYSFAVNWTLHGGKLHTHGAYFMLPGDTPNIELRQADIDPSDESPKPWSIAPYMGAHISGRPLVDIGTKDYVFLNNNQSGTIGFGHSPSYLYQGFTANIDFPIVQPPTKNGVGGALVFKVTPLDAITPFQRAWISNTGNLVEIGRAAFEACNLRYPYDFSGNIWQADSPCKDADYYDTPGWGNLSIVATDIGDRALGGNAAIAIREYGAHGEGLDIGYAPSSASGIDRFGVHGGKRTVAEAFDPNTNIFTYPTKPAFQADLAADLNRVTGDGAFYSIDFDALSFDQAKNFDPSAGTFTAPVTGVYQLEATLQLSGVSTRHAQFTVKVVTTGRQYVYDAGKLAPDVNGRAAIHFAILTRMKAGDTASISLCVEGGAKSVNIVSGPPNSPQTTFSGFLVG